MATELPVYIAPDHVSDYQQLLGDGFVDAFGSGSSLTIDLSGSSPNKYVRLGQLVTATINLPASATRIVFGYRMQVSSGTGYGSATVVEFLNGGGSVVAHLYFNSTTGVIEMRRSTTVLGSTTTSFAGSVAYLEASIVFDDTTGQFDLAVNGATEDSDSGVDTVDAAGPITAVRLKGIGNSTFGTKLLYFRDLYIDARGAGSVDFKGPIVMEPIRGTTDVTEEWTPDTGTSNVARVQEVTHDGDASYVEANTPGDQDLSEMDDVTGTPGVLAFVGVSMVRAPNGGAPTMAMTIDDGVDSLDSSNFVVGSTSTYRSYGRAFLTQPDGVSSWTYGAVNAIRAGYKYISA